MGVQRNASGFQRQSNSHLPPVRAQVLLKSLFNDLQPFSVCLAHFVPFCSPVQDQRVSWDLSLKSDQSAFYFDYSKPPKCSLWIASNAVNASLGCAWELPSHLLHISPASIVSWLCLRCSVHRPPLVRQPLSQNTPAHWESFESNSHKPNRLFSPSIPSGTPGPFWCSSNG